MNLVRIGRRFMKVKNLAFKGGGTMKLNKILIPFKLLVVNIVSILFLLGLIVMNTATYLAFGVELGLANTGAFLVIIALIIDNESRERR